MSIKLLFGRSGKCIFPHTTISQLRGPHLQFPSLKWLELLGRLSRRTNIRTVLTDDASVGSARIMTINMKLTVDHKSIPKVHAGEERGEFVGPEPNPWEEVSDHSQTAGMGHRKLSHRSVPTALAQCSLRLTELS